MDTLADDFRREINRENEPPLILLDILVAFDTIDHGLLLKVLKHLPDHHTGGTIVHWFHSFIFCMGMHTHYCTGITVSRCGPSLDPTIEGSYDDENQEEGLLCGSPLALKFPPHGGP